MSDKFILAIPSKGRLMDKALGKFEQAGLSITKTGHERGYIGEMKALPSVEVSFLSASEIVHYLKLGQVHMGVTGEDLAREYIMNADGRVRFLKKLGFGHADVVVAVPKCWVDVSRMIDLEEIAVTFRKRHGRRLRVATKYMNLTRGFFSNCGVMNYRIVESLGATEGTPAAGTADLIVDITSTGTTIEANHLKILSDGVILKSEANLISSRMAEWTSTASEINNEILERFGE